MSCANFPIPAILRPELLRTASFIEKGPQMKMVERRERNEKDGLLCSVVSLLLDDVDNVFATNLTFRSLS